MGHSKNINPMPTKKDNDASKNKEDDYEQAEHAIFDAVEHAEKAALHAVEHVVHDEVDALFHDLHHTEATTLENKATNTSEKKTSKKKDDNTAFVRGKVTDDYDTAEEAVFKHVEDAEKAMLHAVEHVVHDEVDVLFHDLKKGSVENAGATSKAPAFVRGRAKNTEETETPINKAAEDFIKCVNFD
eukprot:CAMPEP_0172480774 /NCGR_PEP_ID=MMETSP1066-20121228/6206_1 /TAXON_ID=671091 /ORGANISM="Coscinodiscus wailesii, Strain CCMP2513" /LENGTH=185 /DNA_ID=CAMNT_0013242431 /DNA_START=151 /DNA_END=708 /DNA_ORIENTATION=+